MSDTVFTLGGKEYNVVKRGLAQAEQLSGITAWISTYGIEAYKSLQDTGDQAGTVELITAVAGKLSPTALIELHSAVFGCSMEASKHEFDLAELIDGVIALYENSPTVKRIMSRFFSPKASSGTQQSNSTLSE